MHAALEEITSPGYILSAYMRSGSVWLRSLLYDYEISQSGDITLSPERQKWIDLFSPRVELDNFSMNLNKGRTQFTRQIVVTHWHYDKILPVAENKKIVVLYRRPADALVSAYEKRIKPAFRPFGKTPEEWAVRRQEILEHGPDAFCLSLVDTWNDHGSSYIKAAEEGKNCLFMSFESLKKQPQESLAAIVLYFDYPLDRNIVAAAVENRDFSRVKKAADNQSAHEAININRGDLGGAARLLTEETVSEIARRTAPVLTRLHELQKKSLASVLK